MEKEEIIKELMKINESLTDEMIENATKEELEEYIRLTDEIKLKLDMLD